MSQAADPLDGARRADGLGQLQLAAELYWQAFAAGESFGLPDTLSAIAVFFELCDPDVMTAVESTMAEIEEAAVRFERMLRHLETLGRTDDAAVWRAWAAEAGMIEGPELTEASLLAYLRRGSEEAAWSLYAAGVRTTEVEAAAEVLRARLAAKPGFRARHVQKALSDRAER